MLLSPETSQHVNIYFESDSSEASYDDTVDEDTSLNLTAESSVYLGTITDSGGRNITAINAETQTDIDGVDSLLAYSEHLPHDDEIKITLPYIEVEERLVDEVFGQGTPSDLVCCKCKQDGSGEKLSKCYSAGTTKLMDL